MINLSESTDLWSIVVFVLYLEVATQILKKNNQTMFLCKEKKLKYNPLQHGFVFNFPDFSSHELCTTWHTTYGFGKQTCTHSCHTRTTPLIWLHAARDWKKFYDENKFKGESWQLQRGTGRLDVCLYDSPSSLLQMNVCVCVWYVCDYVDKGDPLLFFITNTYWYLKTCH